MTISFNGFKFVSCNRHKACDQSPSAALGDAVASTRLGVSYPLDWRSAHAAGPGSLQLDQGETIPGAAARTLSTPRFLTFRGPLLCWCRRVLFSSPAPRVHGHSSMSHVIEPSHAMSNRKRYFRRTVRMFQVRVYRQAGPAHCGYYVIVTTSFIDRSGHGILHA